MNKSLHQLFIAAITLFAILIASTTWWSIIQADSLNNDPRNTRALYHELSAPRGQILAANGTILAQSEKSSDTFKYQRSYTDGSLYAPVTGFFSVTTRADRGLEAAENQLLTGDSSSQWLSRLQALFTGQENSGATIETSIEPKLQKLAGQLLTGQTGAIVALEPTTGRILALVESPSYDPNLLATHNTTASKAEYQKLLAENPSPLDSIATKQTFEPGAVFDIITAAAALGSGKYTASSSISAPNVYIAPGTSTTVTNGVYWNGYSATSSMSLANAFAYSSNTAFASLGNALGYQALADEAAQFGFGSTITIDGNHDTGIPMTAVPSSFATMQEAGGAALGAIGRGGTRATPLQVAMMVSAVADHGTIMKPTLVDSVRSADLSLISQTTPTVFSKPMNASAAASLTAMMESLVSTQDAGLELSSGAKVAAVIGSSVNTSDSQTNTDWSAGFAPASNPSIVVCAFVENAHEAPASVTSPMMEQLMEEDLK